MSYFLTRILGYSRAADLVFTSRDVNADEAYRLGLLDRLVGADEAVESAVAVAGRITRLPPLAIRSAKRVLQHNVDALLTESLQYETARSGSRAGRRETSPSRRRASGSAGPPISRAAEARAGIAGNTGSPPVMTVPFGYRRGTRP